MHLGCAVKLPKIKWLSEIQGVVNTYLYLTERLRYATLSVKRQFLNYNPPNSIEQTMHRGMISTMVFAK